MSVQTPSQPSSGKGRTPFASIAKSVLIALLGVTFVLITQQQDRSIYRLGITLLIVFTLFQVAFGNIPAEWNFRQSVVGLVIAAVIIGALIFISIQLVPTLVALGR